MGLLARAEGALVRLLESLASRAGSLANGPFRTTFAGMTKKPSPPRHVCYLVSDYTTAHQMWKEVGFPAYQRFVAAPSWPTAMDAAVHAWHIHEWVWHERHPNTDTKNDPEYTKFKNRLYCKYPELQWISDLADAAKHCGLGKKLTVQQMNPAVEGSPVIFDGQPASFDDASATFGDIGLTLDLPNGNQRSVADALKVVIAVWEAHFVGTAPLFA